MSSPFQGRLDDVRIYDRALSAEEILTLANDATVVGSVSVVAGQATLDVNFGNVSVAYPWHNYVEALDTAPDGFVVPLDALVVINELRIHDSHLLPLPPPEPVEFYYDTNHDGWVAPIDALLVINYLSEHLAREGEASPAWHPTLAIQSLSVNESPTQSFFNNQLRNVRPVDRERASVIGPQQEQAKIIAPESYHITDRTRDYAFGQLTDDSETLLAGEDGLETILDELTSDFP